MLIVMYGDDRKVVDIPEEERSMYDNHTQRLDVEKAEPLDNMNLLKSVK